MNLKPLFELQKELDQRIVKEKGLEGQDLLPKKILALQVELGECANEFRGFKFWSNDQEPRRKVYGTSKLVVVKEPLLQEYVDCLHFILSIGLEIEEINPVINVPLYAKESSIEKQFLMVSECVLKMQYDNYYEDLINVFLGLGEMLGFTWEQIEQAYMDKNKVNHERQSNGY